MTESNNVSHPYRWVILILAVLTYLMSMLSRFAWPPLVPVVVPILNISMTEAGLYMTAFYIGYIITQIPAGILGDRFGIRLIMAGTLIVQAVASFFLGSINDFQTGFALRILSGIAGGCVYAVCFRALVKWFPPDQRGLGFGLLMATPSIGVFMTNALVPWLETILSWRGVFQAIGILSAVIGVAVLALVKESPDQSGPAPAAPSGGPKPGLLDGLKYVFGNRNIMLLAIGGFTMIWAQIGFTSWGNTYLKQELQFSLQSAGNIMSSLGFIGIIVAPLSGFLAGKSGKGRLMLIVANLMVLIGILAFGQTSSQSALFVLTIFTGIGIACMNACYSFVTSTYSDPAVAATVGGATSFIYQLAGVSVPMVTGWALDMASFGIVWWILAAGPIVGLMCLTLVTKPPQA